MIIRMGSSSVFGKLSGLGFRVVATGGKEKHVDGHSLAGGGRMRLSFYYIFFSRLIEKHRIAAIK